jgi:23S rRNA (uracil1939-C5)-methyltransferase
MVQPRLGSAHLSDGGEGSAESLTLEINTVVSGGEGLARRTDAPVVFVPRTAPGEVVEVEIVEGHRQWSRGRLLSIVTPGPSRRNPPCPHYAVCGGCQLQHLDYPAQTTAKAGIIADTLRRIGHIEIEPPEVEPSAAEFEYRNRLTFVLRRKGNDVVAGFHSFEDPTRVIDLDRCPLAEPPINRIWAALRDAWGRGARLLPPGAELRLTLRSTQDGEVGLVIEGGRGNGDPETLIETVEGLAAIWRLNADGAAAWYVGEQTLRENWGSQHVELAGDAFLQVNREVAAKLEAYVMEQCGDVVGQRVIDAYCGFGLRALDLAWKGARVVGIDTEEHAIAEAHGKAVESGATARFETAPVERALVHELPADLVLLNPPRAGVSQEVLEGLLKKPPARLIYVSCDPATLARDLKKLGERFQLSACRAFDMFPQTAHVETVVTLTR